MFYWNLALLGAAIFEDYYDTNAFALISLCAIYFILKRILEWRPEAFMVLSYLVFTKALLVFSLCLLAIGFDSPETGALGGLTAGISAMVLLAAIVIQAVCWALPNQKSSEPQDFLKSNKSGGLFDLGGAAISLLLAWGSVCYLIYSGFSNGFPLFEGIDRFAYRIEAGDKLLIAILTLKPVIACALGYGRAKNYANKKIERQCDFSLLGLMGISIVFGDKFLALIALVIFYAIYPVNKSGELAVDVIKKGLRWVLMFSLAVLPLVAYVYSDMGQLTWAATAERLVGRFAAQGQLWYLKINLDPGWLNFDQQQFRRLLSVMGSPLADQSAYELKVGMYELVAKYADPRVYAAMETGEGMVQFAGGFESYFLGAFGWLGLAIAMFVVVIYTLALVLLVERGVHRSSPLQPWLVGFTLLTVNSVWNQGAIWQILGFKAIVNLSIGLIIVYSSEHLINMLARRKI
jgi:hypothetical protein